MNLGLSMRVSECEENGWYDLLSKLDEITQSLIDNPSAGHQIKTALVFWKDAVDCRATWANGPGAGKGRNWDEP